MKTLLLQILGRTTGQPVTLPAETAADARAKVRRGLDGLAAVLRHATALGEWAPFFVFESTDEVDAEAAKLLAALLADEHIRTSDMQPVLPMVAALEQPMMAQLSQATLERIRQGIAKHIQPRDQSAPPSTFLCVHVPDLLKRAGRSSDEPVTEGA